MEPVQFERDRGGDPKDPFGVEAMIKEAAGGANKRGAESEGGGGGKRARVEDE